MINFGKKGGLLAFHGGGMSVSCLVHSDDGADVKRLLVQI